MGNQSKFTILALVVAIIAIGLVSFLSLQGQKPQEQASSSQKYAYVPKIAKADPPQETVVLAPDGKMTLVMKEEKNKESTTYIFSVSEPAGSQKEIYRETLVSGSSIAIPYNTFSPDDKYIFLKKIDQGKNKYFVLSTAGTKLAEDSPFVEFSSMFEAKYPDHKIVDVTGWGGVSLILINTDKASGGQGPSFWFEVPSNKFIQLSTHFN